MWRAIAEKERHIHNHQLIGSANHQNHVSINYQHPHPHHRGHGHRHHRRAACYVSSQPAPKFQIEKGTERKAKRKKEKKQTNKKQKIDKKIDKNRQTEQIANTESNLTPADMQSLTKLKSITSNSNGQLLFVIVVNLCNIAVVTHPDAICGWAGHRDQAQRPPCCPAPAAAEPRRRRCGASPQTPPRSGCPLSAW